MDTAELEQHLETIDEQGYTILERAIEPELVKELADAIRGVERELGTRPKGNPVEGFATLRNYNLLAKGRAFQKMPVHPEVLPLVDRLLEPSCLLSGMTAIHIGPGEVAQPVHSDDLNFKVPKPHDPMMVTTMWALTDFTHANGATVAVPGSHRESGEPDYSAPPATIPIEMPAGSVMAFHGSLWHGGGSNVTQDQWRMGVNVQYCAGYLRTQQNHYLSIPREIARDFTPRLRALCGYDLFNGLMGHVDGLSPAAVLDGEAGAKKVYDFFDA